MFHVKLSADVLPADAVDVEIVARRHRKNAVKDIFSVDRAWNGMHHHVGIGKNLVHRVGDSVDYLFRALKSHVACQADRKIGEISVSRTPYAYPVHFQQSIHPGNRHHNLAAYTGGSGIEQGVDCLSRQSPADPSHNSAAKHTDATISASQP